MRKAIDLLQKFEVILGSIMLGIFLFAVTAQMFTRYAGVTALWTEDVSMYSFICSVFLGAAAMIRDDRHFAFTAIGDKITDPKKKAILNIVIYIIIAAFCVAMLYYGTLLTKKFWNYKWVSIPSFKRGPTWLCVPFSAFTMLVFLAEKLYDSFMILSKGGKQ